MTETKATKNYKTQYNKRNKCADCGILITNNAHRCSDCALKYNLKYSLSVNIIKNVKKMEKTLKVKWSIIDDISLLLNKQSKVIIKELNKLEDRIKYNEQRLVSIYDQIKVIEEKK